jgi:hypothetical protein
MINGLVRYQYAVIENFLDTAHTLLNNWDRHIGVEPIPIIKSVRGETLD